MLILYNSRWDRPLACCTKICQNCISQSDLLLFLSGKVNRPSWRAIQRQPRVILLHYGPCLVLFWLLTELFYSTREIISRLCYETCLDYHVKFKTYIIGCFMDTRTLMIIHVCLTHDNVVEWSYGHVLKVMNYGIKDTKGTLEILWKKRSTWFEVGLMLLGPPFGGPWILAKGYEVLGRRPECSAGVTRPKNLGRGERFPIKFPVIDIMKKMNLKWKNNGRWFVID